MFFPIFIPIHNDCDCDDKHGRGCQCPDCVEKDELRNKPREYYEYVYAIPKKAYRINSFLRVISFLPFVIFIVAIIICMFTFSVRDNSFWITIVVMFGGMIPTFLLFNYIDKFVKYEWNIKGSKRIEKKKWSWDDKDDTWEKVFEKAGVTKDKYHITEPKDNWRYK